MKNPYCGKFLFAVNSVTLIWTAKAKANFGFVLTYYLLLKTVASTIKNERIEQKNWSNNFKGKMSTLAMAYRKKND